MIDAKVKSRFIAVLPAIFFISFSVFTFEVALTRIFSVMLSYHFVFAITSTAMFGLGLGGALFNRFGAAIPKLAIKVSALIFPLILVLAVLAILILPIYELDSITGFGFWFYIILALLPFCAAGLCVSGLFQEYSDRSSLLYGADLLGAAMGALTVVPAMDAFGGVNAVFLAAAIAALGGFFLSLPSLRWSIFALASLTVFAGGFALLIATGSSVPVPIAKDPNKDMYRMLANPAYKAKIVDSRWSSFGRTDLVKSELLPNEMTLFVDGAAGSAMYNLEAILKDEKEKAHLTLHYGEFFPFLFMKDQEKQTALAIGPGGGRDVVIALLGGVKNITAVEVNPDVVQIVKKYSAFNGGIYSGHPQITPVIAEGRNYVRTTKQKFDVIMLSIPVTKSSRSIEGYALTENSLFTTEAFEDYLDRLTESGQIIIVAHNDAEIYKLIGLAVNAFGKRGMSESDAMKHIYTIAADMMPALVIQKQPIDENKAQAIHGAMHLLGFDKGAFFIPNIAQQVIKPGERIGVDKELRMFDQFLVDISKGKLSMATLTRASTIDLRPPSDDRPFFYKFERGLPSPFGFFLFLIVAFFAALIVLSSLKPTKTSRHSKRMLDQLRENPNLKKYLLLFSALGIGYMVIEIAFFQKLMLYIGQPQMALTVLLFSLLLGGGLGSLLSSFIARKSLIGAVIAALGIAFTIILLMFLFQPIYAMPLDPRLASFLLILPLGVLMGCPFPIAMRYLRIHKFESFTSLMWGVNGIASVLGSALAMIVGISWGFTSALIAGAVVYACAAVLFWRIKKETAAS